MTQEEKFNSLFDACVFKSKKPELGIIPKDIFNELLKDYLNDTKINVPKNEWTIYAKMLKSKVYPKNMGKIC